MDESSEILAGLHIHEKKGHHQVEAGCAEADPVDCRVSDQHLTVSSTVGLITNHIKERHLKGMNNVSYVK